MTLDELNTIGEVARQKCAREGGSIAAMTRARTRAMVEALRDEMLDGIALHGEAIDSEDVATWFNEILGAGFAVDEAAGGGSGKQSTQMLPTPAADHPSYTEYMNETVPIKVGPATALDVCEWTFEGGKLFSAQCGGGWWRIEDYQKCPSCARPIKRKSEAAR